MDVHNLGEGYDERREMVLDLLEKVGLPGKQYLIVTLMNFQGANVNEFALDHWLFVPNLSFVIICSALDVSVQAQVPILKGSPT